MKRNKNTFAGRLKLAWQFVRPAFFDRWMAIELFCIAVIVVYLVAIGIPSVFPCYKCYDLPVIGTVFFIIAIAGLVAAIRAAPGSYYERTAVAVFLLISMPIFFLGRGEHNPFIVPMAVGNGPQLPSFGRFGYNYIMGENPVIVENILWFDQIMMFCGYKDAFFTYFTSIRALYSFLASTIAPFTGVVISLATVNYFGWMAAAYISWRFTLRLSGDKLAALIAVVLVSGGLGFVIHSHDYEPHLMSFVMYYIGILLIYESHVWVEARPLKTHLLLGIYLALASINYSNGIFLTVGYIVVSLWRNRWLYVGSGALIALSAQPIYALFLNLQWFVLNRSWKWVSYSNVESGMLVASLKQWAMNLSSMKLFCTMLVHALSQFAFFEFPLVIILGLLAWLILLRSRAVWRFFTVLFFLPIAGGMAYLYTSNTRGYLVSGISLLLYAPLAVVIARGLKSFKPVIKCTAVIVALVIIGCQLFWSTGFIWNYMIPSKIFYGYGLDFSHWVRYLAEFSLPSAYSLTGAEPTPEMFGGHSSLPEAGMYVSPLAAQVPFSWKFALVSRALLACYIGIFVVLAVRSWRAKAFGAGAVALGLWFIPALLPQFLTVQPPSTFTTFYSIHVPVSATARYAVTLSDAFIAKMRKYVDKPVKVWFLAPGISFPFDLRVSGGSRQIFLESHGGGMIQCADVSLPQMLEALDSSREIEMQISVPSQNSNSAGIPVFGWQRAGLPGRKFWELSPAVRSSTGTGSGPTLPAFEIMLITLDQKVRLVGF